MGHSLPCPAMDQAAEPLSFAGEQGDPDCAVLDPHDPTLQPCARPVDDGSWAAGFGSVIPGICSSSLPLSWSLPSGVSARTAEISFDSSLTPLTYRAGEHNHPAHQRNSTGEPALHHDQRQRDHHHPGGSCSLQLCCDFRPGPGSGSTAQHRRRPGHRPAAALPWAAQAMPPGSVHRGSNPDQRAVHPDQAPRDQAPREDPAKSHGRSAHAADRTGRARSPPEPPGNGREPRGDGPQADVPASL